jgi:ATP-dependent HslUV protease ATP-binding subunit HslU
MRENKALIPSASVKELDRYIIGQDDAKRSVAIALRNRWRRQQVEPPLREEIAPKNIIMIGPTGVGKTEIARRLAHLAQSPFIKVEASKFTEVGYVGRDVESMIRDLTQLAINMVTKEEQGLVREKAWELAEEKVLDLLLPTVSPKPPAGYSPDANVITLPHGEDASGSEEDMSQAESASTREKFRRMLREGKLDERTVEMAVPDQAGIPMVEVFSASGMDDMQSSLQDAFSKMFPKKKKQRRVKVLEALELLKKEEAENLVDMESVSEKAVRRTEQQITMSLL